MRDPVTSIWEGAREEPTLLDRTIDRLIGRYRLVYQIASGGMASVYLGRSAGPAGFEKAVAIKTIHPQLAGQESFRQMFLDEVRIASRIAHPNVCAVFDFGEEAGTYYLAMEYLAGEPLSSVLDAIAARPGLFDDPRWHALAVRIVVDACEGLHAAHEISEADGTPLGVVHRDMSPQNLLVTYDGAVKVLDFGVAFALDRIHETTTGFVKGKHAYMAPQQVRGKSVDRRADVWSLGVCLWEMLCGERLFARATAIETLQAVCREPVQAPSVRRRSLPRGLDPVVLRALERDPDRRHPTARAMGVELLDVLGAESFPRTGLADLASLMDQLFPERMVLKARMVATTMAVTLSPGRSYGADSFAAVAGTTDRILQTVSELETSAWAERHGGAPTRVVPWPAGRPGFRAALRHVIRKLAAGPSKPAARPEPAGRARPRDWKLPGARQLAALFGGAIGAAIVLGALVGIWSGGTAPAARSQIQALRATERPVPSSPTPVPGPAIMGTPAPVRDDVGPRVVAPREDPVGAVDLSPLADASAGDGSGESNEDLPAAVGTVARRPGAVDVVSVGGWATVAENGRSLGVTPRRLLLRPGRHVLAIRPFGRGPVLLRPVTVRSGETARVTVRVR